MSLNPKIQQKICKCALETHMWSFDYYGLEIFLNILKTASQTKLPLRYVDVLLNDLENIKDDCHIDVSKASKSLAIAKDILKNNKNVDDAFLKKNFFPLISDANSDILQKFIDCSKEPPMFKKV